MAWHCFRQRVRGGVSADELRRRRYILPAVISVLLLDMVAISAAPSAGISWYDAAVVALFPATLSMILFLVCSVRPAKPVLEHWLMFLIVCICFVDATSAAAYQGRSIYIAVVVLDTLLITNCDFRRQVAAVVLVTIFLCVDAAEKVTDFGWYDAAFFNSMDVAERAPLFSCSDPPCQIGAWGATLELLPTLFCLFTDFYLTRRFAVGLERQVSMVQTSVDVAQDVAQLLACYKVREAEQLISSEGNRLPPGLNEALRQLLTNLDEYRPFLPDSLLNPNCDSTTAPSSLVVPAPGTKEGESEVCICFTDIQSSTALWEACPQAMYEALQLHNSCLRALAAEHSGYEVKTIGDAFMLAFAEAISGCRYGLAVQSQLLQVPWPAALLRESLCAVQKDSDGQVLWAGLRVRIGLHCGAVRANENHVVGRWDYHGTTVNIASRVESTLVHGGLTGVTEAVLDSVGEGGLHDLGSPSLRALPARTVKGIAQPIALHVMVPAGMAERLALLDGDSPQLRVSRDNPLLAPDRPTRPTTPFSMQLGDVRRLTAAVVRCALGSETRALLAHTVSVLQVAADTCSGEMIAIVSNTAYVVWNASGRVCTSRALLCHRFVQALWRPVRDVAVHCGCASGDGFSGNISASRHRHAVVVAGCIELSAALADEAQLCSDLALVVGDVAEYCRSVGCAFRAHLWRLGGEEKPRIVWEVTAGRQPVVVADDDDSDGDDKWGTLLTAPHAPVRERELDMALAAAATFGCQLEACEDMLASLPGSVAKRMLIHRIERCAVRERTLPTFWGLDQSTTASITQQSGFMRPAGSPDRDVPCSPPVFLSA